MPLFSSFSNTGRAKATFPGQAGTPSIVSQASGQVAISWAAPSFSGGAPLTDYKIEYSSDNGSNWTTWAHAASTATSQTVTGLSDYLTYVFRVSGINAVGEGAASSNSAGASQFNAASGGTETTISNFNGTGQTWKTHTFASTGSINITRSITQYRVLAVGGGGNGNGGGPYCAQGSQGARGTAVDQNISLGTGTTNVTVGGGGGGNSVISTITATGASGAAYINSNITGSSVQYPGAQGSDGACGCVGGNGGPGTVPGGGGGSGGGIGNCSPFQAGGGGAGAAGRVVVAYRIA